MSEQTADQIVQWAERLVPTAAEPPVDGGGGKPQGKAGHLSAEQKQAIRVAYLETGGSVTYAEMGRRCAVIIGREVNRETVAGCFKGPEYEALRKHFDTEIKAGAVERLKAGILPAADAWVRAVDVAGDKGDHKPAKELLMHTGVIEPLDEHGRANGPLVLMAVSFGDMGRGHTLDALTGKPRYYTSEEIEARRRQGGHSMVVQIGIGAGDCDINLGESLAPPDVPMYRDAATGEVLTQAEADERSAKHTNTLTVGTRLPGTPWSEAPPPLREGRG